MIFSIHAIVGGQSVDGILDELFAATGSIAEDLPDAVVTPEVPQQPRTSLGVLKAIGYFGN